MQAPDLASKYRAKSDEELLRLAKRPEQLIPEALATLTAELAIRRIDNADHQSISPEEKAEGNPGRTTNRSERLLADSRVYQFIEAVLRIYHGQFWFFVKLTAPAVIIGYFAVMIGRSEGRELARHLPRGAALLRHRAELFEIWLVSLTGYFVSWLALCFSFGAVSSGLRKTSDEEVPTFRGSFAAVLRRMGPFLQLCLLLFFLGLLAEGAAVLLSTGVSWVLYQYKVHLGVFSITVPFVAVFLAMLILSRFALAIPAVVLDNCRAGQAIFRSDELTERKWLILAALLLKSLVGGYVAGMCPFWLAHLIPADVSLPLWFHWILTGTSIAAVAVVEPTLFIGFALLYLQGLELASSPSQEVLTPQTA